jgi:DNA end-binding protein Ku
MRAIWRGELELGGEEIGVKLYAAVQPHASIGFTLLHRKDKTPLKQVLINSATGEPVPREEIIKGYPVSKRKLIPVEPEALEALTPEGSRSIEVLGAAGLSEIDPRYYVRPYFVGPDTGSAGRLAALHAALEKSGKVIVCRWVMRKVRYHGALSPESGALKLVTLRQPEQVLHREQKYTGVELDQRELKTARFLVEALSGDFNPAEFQDEYRERVQEIIDRKAKGLKVPKQAERAARTRSGHLLELLEESLKAAQDEGQAKGRRAAKTTGRSSDQKKRKGA